MFYYGYIICSLINPSLCFTNVEPVVYSTVRRCTDVSKPDLAKRSKIKTQKTSGGCFEFNKPIDDDTSEEIHIILLNQFFVVKRRI